MKHSILALAILHFCSNLLAQTDTTWFDYQFKPTTKQLAAYYRPYPKKEGNLYRVNDYFMNGKLQGTALSADPIKEVWEGPMFGFYQNGDTQFVSNYKNGVFHGVSRIYDFKGKPSGVITYNNGVREGYYAEYEYYYKSYIKKEGFYKNDLPDGNWKFTDKDGIRYNYNFYEGKLHGGYYRRAVDRDNNETPLTFKGEFEHGQVKSYAMYISNEKKPRVTVTRNNGIEEWKMCIGDIVLAIMYFKNNQRTGEWKYFSPDGKQVARTTNYISDSCTDQKEIELKEIGDNWVVLPNRFCGIVDVNTYCSTGKARTYSKQGTLIEERLFSPQGDSILFDAENVPYQLRFDKLTDHYTFYSEQHFYPPSHEEEVMVTLSDETVTDAPPPPPIPDDVVIAEAPAVEEPRVFVFVEQMPEFIGGTDSLLKYFSSRFVYPASLAGTGVGGKVILKFIVNEDGSVSDVTVARSITPEIDKQVVQIAKTLPPFKPGKQRGKPVKTYFSLPVAVKEN